MTTLHWLVSLGQPIGYNYKSLRLCNLGNLYLAIVVSRVAKLADKFYAWGFGFEKRAPSFLMNEKRRLQTFR